MSLPASVIALPIWNSQDMKEYLGNAMLLQELPFYKKLLNGKTEKLKRFINNYVSLGKKCFINPNKQYTDNEINALNDFDLFNIIYHVLEGINSKRNTIYRLRDDKMDLLNILENVFFSQVSTCKRNEIKKELFSNNPDLIYLSNLFLENYKKQI